MPTNTLVKIVSDGLGLILIPWVIWVTVSLFNQRQELALLRQIVTDLKILLERRSHNA
jgi:hypothetical protein